MNKVEQIRKLYFTATAATIKRDVMRAIEILKSMATEEEREKAAVYMDGLSQMRSEWAAGTKLNRGPSAPQSPQNTRKNIR
jgi:hypothetical protein